MYLEECNMTFGQIFDMVLDSFVISFVLVGICVLILIAYKHYTKKEKPIITHTAIVLLYVFMLINITVFRGGLFQNEQHTINIIPFDELLNASYLQASILGKKEAFIILSYNVIGNIVWFIPLGILLKMYLKNCNLKEIVLYAFLFSFTIEILQYIFYTGVSDIDDIIFNVIGAICGYFIFLIIKRKGESHVN